MVMTVGEPEALQGVVPVLMVQVRVGELTGKSREKWVWLELEQLNKLVGAGFQVLIYTQTPNVKLVVWGLDIVVTGAFVLFNHKEEDMVVELLKK
jgi:hypothetical protein